jgi:tetratricopeptide (TPR) repeat protein
MGELDASRRTLDKALLLEPANTELMIRSAQLEHRLGNFAAAENGLQAALASAASANERANAWGALHVYYRLQGRSTAAFDALARRIDEAATFMPPIQLVALRLTSLDVYFETGREKEVRAILDEYAGQLQGPINAVATLAEVQLALENRDISAAETKLAALESMIAANQLESLNGPAAGAGARLAGLKDDWNRAYALRQDVLRANPTDPLVHIKIAEALRHLGRLDEAEQAVGLTLASVPACAPANVELAQVLEARGDAAGARGVLEHALAIWSRAEPDYKPAAEAKALLATIATPADGQ